MSEQNHPWCRDVSRDEAIRAAEDAAANWRRLGVGEVIEAGDEYQKKGHWLPVDHIWFGEAVTVYHLPHRRRRVPLPDHRDLPQAVAELRERVARLEAFTKKAGIREAEEAAGAVNPAADASGGDGDGLRDFRDSRNAKADGLRTERVTLEVRWNPDGEPWSCVAEWLPAACLSEWFGGPGESVRVVEDRAGTDMGNGVFVASTDEVLAMCKETQDRLTAERDAAREAVVASERLRAIAEAGFRQSCARVAELEAAPAANAGGEQQEPVAWGVKSAGEITQVALLQWRDSLITYAESHGGTVVPLFSAPQPPRGWLTPDERQVLTEVAYEAEQSPSKDKWAHVASCVRALLARETPPRGWTHLSKDDCEALFLARAVLDGVFVGSWQEKFDASKRLVDIRDRAIREAGGEVE